MLDSFLQERKKIERKLDKVESKKDNDYSNFNFKSNLNEDSDKLIQSLL